MNSPKTLMATASTISSEAHRTKQHVASAIISRREVTRGVCCISPNLERVTQL